MNDRPTSCELIAAARLYLEQDLIPALTDARLRFQTLVAANVLAICERELQNQEQQLLDEWIRLGQVLHLEGAAPERLSVLQCGIRDRNANLCQQIRAGAFDDPAHFLALCQQLRPLVEQKLAVANPRYLANQGKVRS